MRIWLLSCSLIMALTGCATTGQTNNQRDNGAERRRMMLEEGRKRGAANLQDPKMVLPVLWYTW